MSYERLAVPIWTRARATPMARVIIRPGNQPPPHVYLAIKLNIWMASPTGLKVMVCCKLRRASRSFWRNHAEFSVTRIPRSSRAYRVHPDVYPHAASGHTEALRQSQFEALSHALGSPARLHRAVASHGPLLMQVIGVAGAAPSQASFPRASG